MIGTRGGEEMARLPLRCHVVLPGLPAGANVAVCEWGSHGVRITSSLYGGQTRLRWVAHLDVGPDDVAQTLDCVHRFRSA